MLSHWSTGMGSAWHSFNLSYSHPGHRCIWLKLQWDQPGADSNPALSCCMSVPCTVEPELIFCITNFPLPLGFPPFAHNWIHSLVKDSFKNTKQVRFSFNKILWELNNIFQNVSVLFFSWENISYKFCLFLCRHLTPRCYMLCSPFEWHIFYRS